MDWVEEWDPTTDAIMTEKVRGTRTRPRLPGLGMTQLRMTRPPALASSPVPPPNLMSPQRSVFTFVVAVAQLASSSVFVKT